MADLALASPPTQPSRWLAGVEARRPALVGRWALVAILVLAALFAPRIAPHDPLEQDLLSAQLPPTWMQGGDPAYCSARTASAAACCRG